MLTSNTNNMNIVPKTKTFPENQSLKKRGSMFQSYITFDKQRFLYDPYLWKARSGFHPVPQLCFFLPTCIPFSSLMAPHGCSRLEMSCSCMGKRPPRMMSPGTWPINFSGPTDLVVRKLESANGNETRRTRKRKKKTVMVLEERIKKCQTGYTFHFFYAHTTCRHIIFRPRKKLRFAHEI